MFSRCAPWTMGTNTTGGLIRNSHSQASPRACWIGISGVRPSNLCFNNSPGDSEAHRVWDPLYYYIFNKSFLWKHKLSTTIYMTVYQVLFVPLSLVNNRRKRVPNLYICKILFWLILLLFSPLLLLGIIKFYFNLIRSFLCVCATIQFCMWRIPYWMLWK